VDDVDDERDGRPPNGSDGPDGPDGPDEQRPRTGRMRFQDETTTPREPTLAERRAREIAVRREEEAERQRLADADVARRKRKRILVGAGVTVGVVALIAVGYAVAQPDEEVVAHCVDENNVVVDDANCATPAGGSYYGGGFIPIFIGAGGRQYHYNYGGTGAVGTTVTGGTTTVPRDSTRVTTPSGKTVSRGGLGVGSGSSSSPGSSYGGKSSGS
jgi:hypothetical protein